jgi:hypothetical protein
MTEAATCAWCARTFTPRTSGGREQRFCRPVCRRAYDAAGRRFIADAIACGVLSLDQIRNGAAATRALLAGGMSLGSITRPRNPPLRRYRSAPARPRSCSTNCWSCCSPCGVTLGPRSPPRFPLSFSNGSIVIWKPACRDPCACLRRSGNMARCRHTRDRARWAIPIGMPCDKPLGRSAFSQSKSARTDGR